MSLRLFARSNSRIRFVVLAMAAGSAILPSRSLAQKAGSVSREGACWVQTTGGSVPAGSHERIRIVAEGTVTLLGGSAGHIVYSVKRRMRATPAGQAGAAFAALGVKSRRDGDWLLMTFASPRPEVSGELSITVPKDARVARIDSRGGSTKATDLAGDVQIEAAGGRVDLDQIGGRADINTAGGDVRLGRVNGPVHCFTGAGKIQVQRAGAESRFETAGGDIFVEEAIGNLFASTGGGNIHIRHSGASVVARTAGGLIDVQKADGSVTADTSGGAIQIYSSKGANCESGAGQIRLRNVSGTLRAAAAAGSIFAELLGGRPLLDSVLSTGKGDITVFIPSNLAVTVVARNESPGEIRGIVSDFREIRDKLPEGGRRRPALAEGSLNGGGPVLRVAAAGGTIYLRRQK